MFPVITRSRNCWQDITAYRKLTQRLEKCISPFFFNDQKRIKVEIKFIRKREKTERLKKMESRFWILLIWCIASSSAIIFRSNRAGICNNMYARQVFRDVGAFEVWYKFDSTQGVCDAYHPTWFCESKGNISEENKLIFLRLQLHCFYIFII